MKKLIKWSVQFYLSQNIKAKFFVYKQWNQGLWMFELSYDVNKWMMLKPVLLRQDNHNFDINYKNIYWQEVNDFLSNIEDCNVCEISSKEFYKISDEFHKEFSNLCTKMKNFVQKD